MGHLPRCHKGELVKEALRVLNDPNDLAHGGADLPAPSHPEVEGRCDAARHRDLIGAGGIVARDEGEHRGAVRSMRVLGPELIGVDRSRDRQRLILNHVHAARFFQPRDYVRRLRVVAREEHGEPRRPEP